MKRKEFSFIKQKFEEEGYQVLSTKYQNAHTKLDFICPNQHKGKISWNSFQQGIRCSMCSGNRKNNFESVKECFETEGYKLLSAEYIGASAKLYYICPDGHKGNMSWNMFQQGRRCGQCAGVIDPVVRLKMIQEYFEREGYQLLSTKYKNPSTKLGFICPQGHRGAMRWVSFKRGSRCAKCMGRAIPSLEEIQQYFEQRGCRLLSTKYVDAHSKLDYICPKGHKNSISWTSFYHAGCTCSKCHEPKKQKELGKFLELLFPGKVRGQDRFDFLGLLSVDYSIRDLNLVFEYDGEHHFVPTQYGNMSLEIAKERLVTQQQRDQRKDQLCVENGYMLIRIAHFEEVTLENIKRKIKEALHG